MNLLHNKVLLKTSGIARTKSMAIRNSFHLSLSLSLSLSPDDVVSLGGEGETDADVGMARASDGNGHELNELREPLLDDL